MIFKNLFVIVVSDINDTNEATNEGRDEARTSSGRK